MSDRVFLSILSRVPHAVRERLNLLEEAELYDKRAAGGRESIGALSSVLVCYWFVKPIKPCMNTRDVVAPLRV